MRKQLLLFFCSILIVIVVVGCGRYTYCRKITIEPPRSLTIDDASLITKAVLAEVAKSNGFTSSWSARNRSGKTCICYATRRNDLKMYVCDDPLYVEMITDKHFLLDDIRRVQAAIAEALNQTAISNRIYYEEEDVPRPIFDVK